MRDSSRTKTNLAPFIAFLVPGGGHMLLGRPAAGLLLLLGTLTDIAAMIRLADEGGGQFALFIIFLGMGVPCFWFFSVFGALQLASKLRRDMLSTEGTEEAAGARIAVIVQGAAAIVLGCILTMLVQTSIDFSKPIESFATYAPGVLLIVLAFLIISYKGKHSIFKMGRFSAAAILLAVGGLLLWDQIQGRNAIGLFGQWWPAAFVLLGIEVVVTSFAYRYSSRRPAFDIGGAFLAVVVAITAFAVTQYAAMPLKWLDEFNVNLTGTSGFGEEKGFRYAIDEVHQPLLPETTNISIDNANGSVTVKKGDVEEIVIESEIWVDSADKAEADETAEKSMVEVNGGKKVEIKADGHSYGTNGERKPRMNMVVTIPVNSSFGTPFQPPVTNEGSSVDPSDSSSNTALNGTSGTDPETSVPNNSYVNVEPPQTELSIGTVNGSVDISDLMLYKGLTIKVTSGEIVVNRIQGPIDAETKNGSITARTLQGNVKLDTYNGDIKASDIAGSFDGSTLSGSIDLQRVSSDVDTDTKNGQIGIKEALGAIRADTLNGDINVTGSTVGGDWDIDSSIGEIHVVVPESGDYSINGSVTFGDITSDLPLNVNKKTIRGTIGAGTYRINIDANSSIEVNRYKP